MIGQDSTIQFLNVTTDTLQRLSHRFIQMLENHYHRSHHIPMSFPKGNYKKLGLNFSSTHMVTTDILPRV